MIEIRQLRKVYPARGGGREVVAVDGVDLDVGAGEIYGVLGRSGAGKSTLIRCVNLLERPTSGSVVVDGQNMTALNARQLRAARRRIGMVFQHFNLLSSRTVAGNVALPLEIAGVPRRERIRRVGELLELVGLSEKGRAYPAQLSGGQRQRVAIARALAGRPRVLLSDEATSALDSQTTAEILDLLRDLSRQLGLTILLITHELEVVKRICDSAAVMAAGKILESGRVADLLARPDSALARAAFPLDGTGREGSHVVDVVVRGAQADQPLVATLARRFDLDVNILSASVRTIGGQTVGRLRLELPGRGTANTTAALAYLAENGLIVGDGPTTDVSQVLADDQPVPEEAGRVESRVAPTGPEVDG